MAKLFSFSLFFLSFVPLWISILFIDIKSIVGGNSNTITEWISIGCIITGMLACVSILFLEFQTKKNQGSPQYCIVTAKEEKNVTTEFLLSYILPLSAFDFTCWDNVVLFLIFFLTIAGLCLEHNYFSANVALEIMKYRIYNCVIRNEDGVSAELMVISHRQLRMYIGEEIHLKSLNNEYMIDVDSIL